MTTNSNLKMAASDKENRDANFAISPSSSSSLGAKVSSRPVNGNVSLAPSSQALPMRLNPFEKRKMQMEDYCSRPNVTEAGYGMLNLSSDRFKFGEHSILELAFEEELKTWDTNHRKDLVGNAHDEFHIDRWNHFVDYDQKRKAISISVLMDEPSRNQLYSKLTPEDVDRHYHVMIVRVDRIHKIKQRLEGMWYTVLERNVQASETTFLMNRIVEGMKLIDSARQTLTGGRRSREGRHTTIPNVARDAFEHCLATMMLCDGMSNWRYQGIQEAWSDRRDCQDMLNRIGKMLQALLWFRDDELGFVDPVSRKGFLKRVDRWSNDWSTQGRWHSHMKLNEMFGDTFGINNNSGMGRSLNPLLSTPLPRPSTTSTNSFMLTQAPSSSYHRKRSLVPEITVPGKDTTKQTAILKFLTALGEKSSLREKSHVQLQIGTLKTGCTSTSDPEYWHENKSPDKWCRIIVPGGMDMKNLGKLMAFLTGRTLSYGADIRRLNNSFFEFCPFDNTNAIIGSKDHHFTMTKSNIPRLYDKSIKIIQIFQGLITLFNDGVKFDSSDAKSVWNAHNSLVWYAPNEGPDKSITRCYICCQGVVANSCIKTKSPLPRILDGGYFYGRSVKQLNQRLHQDSKLPKGVPYWCSGDGDNDDESSAFQPICDPKGFIVNQDLKDSFISTEKLTTQSTVASSVTAVKSRSQNKKRISRSASTKAEF